MREERGKEEEDNLEVKQYITDRQAGKEGQNSWHCHLCFPPAINSGTSQSLTLVSLTPDVTILPMFGVSQGYGEAKRRGRGTPIARKVFPKDPPRSSLIPSSSSKERRALVLCRTMFLF
ncbi:hypothetical protein E2C01_054438 [Portunus trituberculatus]|uniref:Uncharacterized protein n=1 Tax=Portunus trituberculatus TaxID=210409 RepID=A0A5B7GV08_PORTR|nr:hypothetical protein [Portunus trituberculatus]